MKSVHRRSNGARARHRPGERAQLRIEALAAGGAGVGRLAGEVVFVPATAPGDLVEVELDRSARPARGRLLGVVEPSADRVAPPCRFTDACGGCDWMHVRIEAQQAAHEQIVRQAIARATSLAEAELPPIRVHPAPLPLGYRSRARLFARGARRGARGLSRAEDARRGGGRSLRGAGRRDRAARRRATRRPPWSRGGGRCPDLAGRLEPPGGRDPVAWSAAAGRVAAAGRAHGARRVGRRPRHARRRARGRVVRRSAAHDPEERTACRCSSRRAASGSRPRRGRPSSPAAPPSSPTSTPTRPPHVLELFAGSGTLSVLLARGAQRPSPAAEPAGAVASGPAGLASFTAVELSSEAVACLRQNLAARGLAGKAIEADADQYPIPARTDVVVLDPPRSGAPGAARAIAASSARVVVYVSCDPATLARDLGGILRGGFEITDIEAVELFPQDEPHRVDRAALPRPQIRSLIRAGMPACSPRRPLLRRARPGGPRAAAWRRRPAACATLPGMIHHLDDRLREEARRYRLVFACPDCASFDPVAPDPRRGGRRAAWPQASLLAWLPGRAAPEHLARGSRRDHLLQSVRAAMSPPVAGPPPPPRRGQSHPVADPPRRAADPGRAAARSRRRRALRLLRGPDSTALLHVLSLLRRRIGHEVVAHGVDHGLAPRPRPSSRSRATCPSSSGFLTPRPAWTWLPARTSRPGRAPPGLPRWQPPRRRAAPARSRPATPRTTGPRRCSLRLLRGAGPRGLAVLPPRAPLPSDAAGAACRDQEPRSAASIELIRPLLQARRADVLAHLGRHRLAFAEDPSSRDPRFTRVRVRRELLPLLEDLSPAIVEHLCALTGARRRARSAAWRRSRRPRRQ